MIKQILILTGMLIFSNLHAQELQVTLLGTGTPRPDIDRFGPATLIEYKNKKYLFDVGRGATIRLGQVGIAPSEIDHLFVTHLHSDHITGFADLWLTGWIWQRRQALEVFGPEGVENLVGQIKTAYSKDIAFRQKQTNLRDEGLGLNVETIREGIIFDNEEVTITAIAVEHGAVEEAYAFRFDTAQNSVLISGDTTFSNNLVKHGRNLDLLVHELAVIDPGLLEHNPRLRKVAEYHSSLDQVEKVVEQIQPKQTVLNHLLLIGYDEISVEKDIQARFGDDVSLGHDLMKIHIPPVQP